MFGYVPPVARMEMSKRRPQAAAGQFSAGRIFAPGRAARSALMTGLAGVSHRPLRGVIIDLDDTLYPRERFVRSGFAAVAAHVSACHGIEADAAYGVMTRAFAAGRTGSEMQALCAAFDLPADLVPGLIEVFRSHTPSLFLGPDAQEALRKLRADGWGIVILTNGLPSVQFRKVAALGLAAFVDEVIYADEHAPGGKPAVAPFRAALQSLDLTPEQCVCVGDDATRDIRGAKSLGIATIRIARPEDTCSAQEEADLVIHSLRQLPQAAALLLSKDVANVA
jgi:putative hydrolase of the HAD superfamily